MAVRHSGSPATTPDSIPHSSSPRMIRKNPKEKRIKFKLIRERDEKSLPKKNEPFSPQSEFHELAQIQYGVPFSVPHPIIFTA
ncbi:hypothetical protein NECAME_17743 [Necator americanus]|uniref:Uncharacterized protein n=1 Tax=Necator americanus TaxID=51031 RepID=W2TKP6_NECAM|nr:hypothetical protein NECAME_17743 [Necator americanus]ETN82343.1 hypothetical protein NECAME_17743 [Necator americanus]